jgi:hypothetical protein
MPVLRSRKACKIKAHKTECGSRKSRCRWVITTTIIITAVSWFASGPATLAIIITTTITTITTTTEVTEEQRGVRSDALLLFSFADLGFCRAEQMAIGAVEDGVGFRGPR